MFFALKADKGLRLYVDYCELNAVMVKDCYSLPLIDKMLSYLGCYTLFLQDRFA